MSKTIVRFASVILIGSIAGGCAMFGDDKERQKAYPVGSRMPAEFINSEGMPVGTAIMKQTPNGVLMDVELRNLSPGWHAFHIHETGRCDTPDFESAGGHYNPGNVPHGFEVKNGYHAGDFPNIYVNERGTAQFQLFTKRISLGGDDRSLFDNDGSAIVVHSGQDNYRAQPSGEAGARVACAAIKR